MNGSNATMPVSVLLLAALATTATAQPISTEFSYQGQIKVDGTPYTGSADFGFALYDTAEGPAVQVGSTVEVSNVSIENGLFTVQLDFGAGAFNGDARWLDVSIRTPHDPGNVAEFTTLSPRTKITATPYAGQTRGLFADESLNVGVGTTEPTEKLEVDGNLKVGGNVIGNARFGIETDLEDGVLDDASDSSPYSRISADSFHTQGLGEGQIYMEGAAIDANRAIEIGAGKAGGQTARDVRLGDNDELFVDTSSGRVGIGTPSPTTTLDVNGTVTATAFSGDGSALTNLPVPSSTWTDNNPHIYYNGGNVGIGTNSPDDLMTVYGGDLTLQTPDNALDQALNYRNSAGAYAWRMYRHDAGGNNADLRIAGGISNADISQLSERLTISSIGFVGIGTTDPQTKLHVQGNSSPELFLESTTSGSAGVVLGNTEQQYSLRITNGEKFIVRDVTDANTDRLTILPNGNVGIGATNPQVRFSLENGGTQVGITQGNVGLHAMELTTQDGAGNQATRLSITGNTSTPNYRFYNGDLGSETVVAEIEDNAGVGGQMRLFDPAGVNRVNLTATGTGGKMHLYDTAGTTHVLAQTTSDGGNIELKNNAGEDRVAMSITNYDVGYVNTYGPNGSYNIRLTNLADNFNNGFLAIYDQNGDRQAAAFVNADGDGEMQCDIMQIYGGSDIAEPFNINVDADSATQGNLEPIPGMLVSIDPDRIGELRVADTEYDPAVAGVISGAGGVNPGMTLQQKGTVADGKHPVALTGRVFCYVDADANGAVRPGDRLTTSSTPGHAMKATDRQRLSGTVIGKAMSALDSGQGLVLVLVNLQ